MASELPPELRAQLRTRVPPIKETACKMTGEFSLDDVLVAHWQRTKLIAKRPTVSNALAALCSAGVLRRVGSGRYVNKGGEK